MKKHYGKNKLEAFSKIIILICISLLTINPIMNLATAPSTWKQETDTDFQSGTLISLDITGTGTSAGLILIKYGSGDWVQQAPYTYPPASNGHAMASVYGTDKVVTVTKGDTWVFDLSDENWTVYNQSPKPSVRTGHRMASVHGTNDIVLFGGFNSGIYYGDTWVFNASTNKWKKMNPSGNVPIGRNVHSMATIYGTDKVLMFGGHLGSVNSNDTFVYDLSSNRWTKKNPKALPSRRNYHAMASIHGTDKILMYGGWPDNSETWIYDLSKNDWTLKSPKNNPKKKANHGMATLYGTDEVLLFGGREGKKWFTNETWIYDYSMNNWIRKLPGHSPCSRTDLKTATVYGTNKIVLFGGKEGMNYLRDTWVYNMTLSELKGMYISKPHDTGGNSTFNSITWSADIPNNTSLTFQLRSAPNASSLIAQDFVGPKGTQSSFYTATPGNLWSGHYGDQWIQYRAYFNSSKYSVTPTLKNFKILYNCWPVTKSIFPSNNKTINISKPHFIWKYTDIDSAQQAKFQVLVDDDPGFNSINYDSKKQVSSNKFWYFPYGTTYKNMTDGTWYWKVRTKDSDGDWGLYSDTWNFSIDTKAPRSSISVPQNNGFYSGLNFILGNAKDVANGSGVAKVEIIIKRLIDNYTWDGSVWTKPKTWISAGSEEPWSYNTSMVSWISGVKYQVRSKATDYANNTEAPGEVINFTFDFIKPLSNIFEPLNKVWLNKLDEINGNASDLKGSGVKLVDIAIERLDDNNYWYGDQWNTTEYWLPTNGKQLWEYNSTNVTWTAGSVYVVRSRATDNLLNIETPDSGNSFKYDDVPPEELKITINDDAEFTNSTTVKLSIDAIDVHSWVTQMAFSTDGELWTKWETFENTRNFELPTGDGIKDVWLKVKDYVGNIAVPVKDSILLDTTPPENLSVVINDNDKFTNSLYVELALAANDSGSGLDISSFSFDGIIWTYWEKFSENRALNLTIGDGEKNVYFKVRDRAGNIAEHVYDTIILDTTPPHSLSILINQDELKTNSTSVILMLNATDDTSGVAQMMFSTDSSTWTSWELFATSRSYTLLIGDGEKFVYFKVNDRASNIAFPVFDSIMLDATINMTDNITIPEDKPNDDDPIDEKPEDKPDEIIPGDEPLDDDIIDNDTINVGPDQEIPVDVIPGTDVAPRSSKDENRWNILIVIVIIIIIGMVVLMLVRRRKKHDEQKSDDPEIEATNIEETTELQQKSESQIDDVPKSTNEKTNPTNQQNEPSSAISTAIPQPTLAIPQPTLAKPLSATPTPAKAVPKMALPIKLAQKLDQEPTSTPVLAKPVTTVQIEQVKPVPSVHVKALAQTPAAKTQPQTTPEKNAEPIESKNN
jgi:hypothetical protein